MKHQLKLEKITDAAFLLTATTLLFLLTIFYYHTQTFPWISNASPSPPPPLTESKKVQPEEHCDLFRGDWAPDPDAPYYTNETCTTIHEHQNCMKHRRPDTGFMRWRWKPEGCEVPRFDPEAFLDLVKGKSMAFVGDSVARNHMQSLLCLLSRVTHPVQLNEMSYFYPKYNFTVVNFWSTFLVKVVKTGPDEILDGAVHLHVDKPDVVWAASIETFDYVIVSAGQWFFRPSFLYEDGKLIGCFRCSNKSLHEVELNFAYRRAFRSVFAYLDSLPNYNGTTFLRTYSPSHFENGAWNDGGDCLRTSPWRRNETSVEGYVLYMRQAQVEEFEAAAKRGSRYHLLDITRPMALRPDGHPSRYGRMKKDNTSTRDCVHWCLPGPIDSWNDILLEMMKTDRLKVATRRQEGEMQNSR